MNDLEERTRGFLRNHDWLEALEDMAQEGRALAHELDREQSEWLLEVGRNVRRAADHAAFARARIRLADRTLLGGE